MSTHTITVPFTYQDIQTDTKHGYTIYSHCKLDKSKITLSTQCQNHTVPIYDLDKVPLEYEQISFINDDGKYYLENFDGCQFGVMWLIPDGTVVIKAHERK
jgi:hypothetical protein